MLRRPARAASITLALALAAAAATQAADRHQTSAGPVTVERVVDGLDTPWAVGFLPDGGLLITERDGRLWHVDAERRKRAVAGLPEVYASGQGGLLDVVVARDFATSREIFLSYAAEIESGAGTAIAAARLSADARALEDVRVLFRQSDPSGGGRHFGSRIVEAPDGTLFFTIGDRGEAESAQSLSSHRGKVLRIARDGSVPTDNPYRAEGGLAELWSIGHRNSQGLALDPATGQLWTVAHGARGGDEINLIAPGVNYGWPTVSYGRNYSGTRIGIGTEAPGLEGPRFHWDPSIAPSGMAVYSGRLWPEWTGHVFVGSLKDDFLSRLTRDGDRVGPEERLFEGDYARIRDVREGPDGAIWFLAESDGALYRMIPTE